MLEESVYSETSLSNAAHFSKWLCPLKTPEELTWQKTLCGFIRLNIKAFGSTRKQQTLVDSACLGSQKLNLGEMKNESC